MATKSTCLWQLKNILCQLRCRMTPTLHIDLKYAIEKLVPWKYSYTVISRDSHKNIPYILNHLVGTYMISLSISHAYILYMCKLINDFIKKRCYMIVYIRTDKLIQLTNMLLVVVVLLEGIS